MYAHNRYGVLICLQGWILQVRQFDSGSFKDFNSEVLLCTVLKHLLERAYDYLWRHYLALPEKENLPF
jgi:hypothetical protein